MSQVIAAFIADLHLSSKPPPCRALELSWHGAQARILNQVRDVAKGLPLICCGDVFDKHNAPAETINFALEFLPQMIAIPGNHDQ